MPKLKAPRVPLDFGGMVRDEAIFRLSGASRRDTAVERWLGAEPVELRSIAGHWFTRIRQRGDDVVELMHDGAPTACVGDAAFAYVNSFKAHVNLGFFHGSALDDPAGLLEGSGKRMRHVKLKPGAELDSEALRALIQAAYKDIKRRLRDEASG